MVIVERQGPLTNGERGSSEDATEQKGILPVG